MRVLILVNTLDRVSSFVYVNHIQFAAYNGKHHSDIQFFWKSPHRQTIDTARNEAAMDALKLECDYLMFVDDDVLIPPNAFQLLLDAKHDICAGLVYLRGYPFHVMAFKEMDRQFIKDHHSGLEIEDPRLRLTYYDEIHEKTRNGEKIIPCAAVGFSCCLISTDVFKTLEPPYFVTGPLNTEDVYFCLKTRGLEPKPTIAVNTDVRCGHILNPEPIEFDTRTLLTNFYDNLCYKFNDLQNPNGEKLDELKNVNNRSLEYVKRNLARL